MTEKAIDVSVFGLGYVGLPLLLEIGKNSSGKSIGVEISESRLKKLNSGISFVDDISNGELQLGIENGIKFSNDANYAVNNSEISVICVPTPVDMFGNPYIGYILSATESIASTLSKKDKSKHLIILESTTYPTTTEEDMLNVMTEHGLILHDDYELCFSPERIDPGNKQYHLRDIPKIIGGTSEDASLIGKRFYEEIVRVKIILASSPRVAEMTKLFENIFRQVNIALVNELAVLAEKLQIDIYEVIQLASTKPFGFLPHYPGPGLGGHCIPVDPYYLSYIAKKHKFRTKFIDLASEINDSMASHTVDLIKLALNRVHKSVKRSNIAFLGIAYKPNISDLRNSPVIPIANVLTEMGGNIFVCDKLIDATEINYPIKGVDEIYDLCDIVVITTPHEYFDFDTIHKSLADDQPLVDTRGVINTSSYREIDIGLGRGIREYLDIIR